MIEMTHYPQYMPSPVRPQTFRTFVTAPRTAVAYNAALTVALRPGAVHNPLFICGESGLGKTHLLNAIARQAQSRLGPSEIVVVSAERFADEYMSHLRRGLTAQFRRRYRRVGALLIDDLSALVGRDAVLDELAETVSALRSMGRQVVLADRQRPSVIVGLAPRTLIRLGIGPVAVLGQPNEEARLAILDGLVEAWGVTVSRSALALIAARLQGSVRDLQHAVARLAEIALTGRRVSVAQAARIAADMSGSGRSGRGPVLPASVIAAVCDYFELSLDRLVAPGRGTMAESQARQVAMYLLREDAGLTTIQVGMHLHRDHSTVLHGCGRIAATLDDLESPIGTILRTIRQALYAERTGEDASIVVPFRKRPA